MSPTLDRLVRAITFLILLAFLLFGLVRLGVGAAMGGQVLGNWDLGGDIAVGVSDVRAFLSEHNAQAIITMTPVGYFSVIAAMGVALIFGAGLFLVRRRKAGLVWLALYLLMHAGLFVNFGVINPKLQILAVTVAAWGWLFWRRHAGIRRAPASVA